MVTHFESFSKGVLDTKDIIFYLSMIFLGLVSDGAIDGIAAVEGVNENRLDERPGRRVTRPTPPCTSPIILAVLGVVNFLANRYNKTWDSTANKQFSLSDQTEKVVKNLKQDVKIRYFDRTSEFQRAKDLLDRYDNLSTKLSVEYIDPDKKPQVAKAENVRTYGTIFVQTGAKKEEAKSLTEEEVTGALVRALKSGERTVCVVSGSGEHSLDDTQRTGYSSLKEALEKNNYKTRTISLLGKSDETAKPGTVKLGEAPAPPATVKLGEAPAAGAAAGIAVPKDCTILLVGGPRYDYMEPAVNAIQILRRRRRARAAHARSSAQAGARGDRRQRGAGEGCWTAGA